MSAVVNRIAVIAPDANAFFALMKNYNISMYSKAKCKFWTHKGATEYFLASSESLRGYQINGILMTEGCQDMVQLYLDAHANLNGPPQITQAEKDAAAEVDSALVAIASAEQETKHS